MKKKAMALVLALGLVVVGIVSGTMAWLTANSTEVKNTFTDSDINIVLDESKLNADGLTLDTQSPRVKGNSNYKMIPGHTISKDPMVTLDKDSEACYLFVKIEENLGSWSDNGKTFKDYLIYSVDTNIWTALPGNDGIYYKEVDTSALKTATEDLTYKIIENDTITVSGDNVTKEMMDQIDGENVAAGSTEVAPTLTFKAAAVQLYKTQGEKFNVAAAYAKVAWPTSNP